MFTPPRSSLIRDALAALADSPNPAAVAEAQQEERRARDRQRREVAAILHSPGGRGQDAGALDLVSLFGASGREFVPGPGVQGPSLEMEGGTRAATRSVPMQGASVAVPASVSLNVSGSRLRSYSRRRYSRSYGRSRSRSTSRVSYYQKRAIARRAYIRGKYPSATYAHPYVVRGSAAAQAMGISPGVTFKDASPEEQVRRRAVGWYGKGDYVQASAIAPMTMSAPSFTGRDLDGSLMNKGGVPQIIRKEVFFNVTTPATQGQQSIQEFVVNAGLDEMFPFGSQIANKAIAFCFFHS